MLSLTRDQREALTKIKNFLNSKTHDCFVLGGYAGTGKTTLLSQVIEYLKSHGESFSLMASTGKAAFALRKITGEKAFTVHRVIYDFDNIDFDTVDASHSGQDDDFLVRFYYKFRRGQSKVYIVDEASLISDYYSESEFLKFGSGKVLSDLIKEHIGFNSDGRLNGKLIFCGDIGQLPPANMNFSPAMNVEYLSKNFNIKVDSYFLKEVLRGAKVEGIQKTVEKIRRAINDGKFNYFYIAPGDRIIHLNDEDDLRNEIAKLFKGSETSIIISYTNEKAAKYNYTVKSSIGLDPNKIEQGDRLLVYRNNYFYPIEFYNGQELEVVKQPENEERFEIGEISYADLKVRTFDYENGEFVETNVKILQSFLFSNESEANQKIWKDMFKIAIMKDDKLMKEYENYTSIKKKLKKNKNDPSLNKNKELHEVAMKFGELIRENPYLNPIMAKFGYAVTCHKAQGSEWDNVIIDLNTSGLNPVSELFFRWAYTAITRSKKRVYILNNFAVTPLFKVEVKREIIKPERLPPEEERFYREEELDDEDIENLEPDFVRVKYSRIIKIFSKIGIEVECLDNSKWRLRLRFFNGKNEAVLDLPYSKGGFTGMYRLIDTSSEDFGKEVISKLEDLNYYADENVPMPSESWKKDVFTLIKALCEKFEIKITNFVEKQYSDRYYLITESKVAWIDLFYNNKGLYSTVVGYSLLGDEDEKLINLLNGIENSKEIIPWEW